MSNSGGGEAPPSESQGVVNLLAAELRAKSLHHQLSLSGVSDEMGKAFFPLIKKALKDGDYQEAYVQYAVARSFEVKIPQKLRDYIRQNLLDRITYNFGNIENVYPMKLYIEMGFDPNWQHPRSKINIINFAVLSRSLDWLKYLVEEAGIDPNTQDGTGSTPAFIALVTSQLPMLEYLVEEAGIDPNTQHRNGDTLTKTAIKKGNLPMLRYLRDRGADIMLGYSNGTTPFLLAAAELKFNIVEELYEEFGVNSTDNHGNTALHYASRSPITMYYEDIVRFLVDHGADINKQNDRKQTPFWLAVKHSKTKEDAQLLIDLGADTTIPGLSDDGSLTTPKQEAFLGHNYLLSELLS